MADGTGESVRRAAMLYGRAAVAMNFFFASRTGRFCADCLALHREYEPEGPVASNTLVSGVFPGCCQSGVDGDFRVPGKSVRLPEALTAYIEDVRSALQAPGVSEYGVFDGSTGQTHTGKGCRWLGGEGCVLGRWKSPICLTYLCEPARAALERECGREGFFGEEDFLGSFAVFEATAKAALGGEAELSEARTAVKGLISRVKTMLAG